MTNIVIIGMGNMGGRYLTELSKEPLPNLNIYGVQTKSLDKNNQIGIEYPNLKIFPDFDSVLADPMVDGILITTPNRFHYSMAKQALEKGKHVLVEKPAAITEEEISELIQIATETELVCEVVFQSRFDPKILRIKELLPSLGRLQRYQWENLQYYRGSDYFTQGSWDGTWQHDGGGILLNQAIHQIDLTNFLFGMPQKIVSKISFGKYLPIEVDDEAVMILDYTDGLTGTFIASFNDPIGKEKMIIVGEKGQIVMTENRIVFNFGKEEHSEIFDKENQWEQNRRDVVADFLQSVSLGLPPVIPISTNYEALQIIRSAWLSTWENRWVKLPISNEDFERGFVKYKKEVKKWKKQEY